MCTCVLRCQCSSQRRNPTAPLPPGVCEKWETNAGQATPSLQPIIPGANHAVPVRLWPPAGDEALAWPPAFIAATIRVVVRPCPDFGGSAFPPIVAPKQLGPFVGTELIGAAIRFVLRVCVQVAFSELYFLIFCSRVCTFWSLFLCKCHMLILCYGPLSTKETAGQLEPWIGRA